MPDIEDQQLKDCHITGRFECLHKKNYAWILKAVNSLDSRVVLRLLPGKNGWFLPDWKSRSAFLQHFNLNMDIQPFNPECDSMENDLSKPGSNETEQLVQEFIQSQLNQSFFPSFQDIAELFDTTTKPVIVTTNGCFDLLHPGHVSIIKKAKTLGDKIIVAINSDESVKRFKGKDRPLHNQFFRGALLSSIPFIDFVTIFHEDTPLHFLDSIKPAYHVKGGSFVPDRIKAECDLLKQWGGELVTLPMVGNYATSKLLSLYSAKSLPF